MWHVHRIAMTAGVVLTSQIDVGVTGSAVGSTRFPSAFLCFEYNSDYSGGEISRFPTFTHEECHERCRTAENCVFFNYHVLSSLCVLRSGTPYSKLKERNNVLSGPKECLECGEDNVGYEGKPTQSADANSATHCQYLCAANEGCKVFTFDTISRKCDMFAAGSNLTSQPNKISGKKSCSIGDIDRVPAPPCSSRSVKYGKTPLSTVYADDAKACQQMCQLSSSCEAFAFDISKEECNLHLANSEGMKQIDSVFISGPRECNSSCLQQNTDYDTSDYLEKLETGVSTPEECQLRCQASAGCNAWAYALEGRNCNLLKSFSGSHARQSVVSGPKFCSGACNIMGYHAPAAPFSWYSTLSGKSLDECRDACKVEPKCGIFTWWPTEMCYLKDESCLRNQEPKEGGVQTGWIRCSACFRQGVGYKADGPEVLWSIETQNAEECRQRCALMENCTRFTYDAAARKCSMLSGEAGDVKGDNLQSGPANCDVDDSCILDGVKLLNNDNIIRTYNEPSNPEGCQALCASNVRCRFFTFYAGNKECNLKTGVNGIPILTTKESHWISGPKKCVKPSGECAEQKTDYNKGDIYTAPLKITDQATCRQSCYNEPQCRVYTLNTARSECWLKTINGFNARKAADVDVSGGRLGCLKCLRAGIAYTGPLVKEVQYPTELPCQLACEENSSCKFFTFTNGVCKLLESMGEVQEAPYSTVSGPKQC